MPEVSNVSPADLYKIARLAARVYANCDTALLSPTEQQLVTKLEEAGFLKEETFPLGFTGDTADEADG